MKKFLKSRGFLTAVLSVACVGILAVCWYVGRDAKEDFAPEESTSSAATQDWQEADPSETSDTETGDRTPTESSAALPVLEETSPMAEYPKVAEESGEETIIDFTPTEKAEETAPPAPEGKTVLEDPGEEHPINPAPEVTAPETEAPASKAPSPGASNENGAVYDPVFGWVVPGQVNQSTMDSDGDPNKMVGNMGN